MRKRCICLLLLLVLLGLFGVLPAAASDSSHGSDMTMPEEYREMLDALPDAVRDSLPPALLSTDPAEAAAALQAFLSPSSLLRSLAALLLSDSDRWLRALASLVGILLLRAVIARLGSGVGGALSSGFSLLCRLSFVVLLLEQVQTTLQTVTAFFDALTALTNAYLPLMAAMYAMGGNVATATVNQSTLLLWSTLVSRLGGQSVLPVFCLCLAMSIAGALGGELGSRLGQLSTKIKKWYTTAVSLCMLLLSAILAAQSTLTARADSLGFKTVRFFVANQIPLVGGSVAEMLRTAAAQLSFLRSLVGIGGIVLLLWLLLPALLQVLVARMVCTLGSDAALWLDCPEEGRLLSELGSLYGYLLAVVSVSIMTFFLSFVLLLRCAVAYGA